MTKTAKEVFTVRCAKVLLRIIKVTLAAVPIGYCNAINQLQPSSDKTDCDGMVTC